MGDPNMRPVSVGIFGSWGTGKSTLLNLIEARLSQGQAGKQNDYLVIRFDAWLYQGYDDARAALMEVIASALLKAAKTNDGLFAKAKKLFGRVDKIRALGLAAEGGALAMGIPMFGWASKAVEAVGKVVSGEAAEEDADAIKEAGSQIKAKAGGLLKKEKKPSAPKEIAAFRREFQAILKELGKTLVVFVDNLDRCLPKQTIQTLEALRLFLFMKSTAFVVAADEEMVRHSVTEFFKSPGERHVTDYLDKLIQVPVRVPRLGIPEVRAYLFQLIASSGGHVTKERQQKLHEALERNMRLLWKEEPITAEAALAELGDGVAPEIKEGFAVADRIAPILAGSKLVNGNPRIVKRMMNVVRMRAKIARLREMPVNEALIAKLALFERCTDSAAIQHLYSEINEASEGMPGVIRELESSLDSPDKFKKATPEAWSKWAAFLSDWLGLEPKLANVDLRPLVYLSRETLPLRARTGSLSAAAADAFRALKAAQSISSESGRGTAASIPPGEQAAVMAALIETFRTHSDWSKKPPGFDGALILANVSSDAGAVLDQFVPTTASNGKLRPWMRVLLKGAAWYSGEGAK
ncbi:KAP family P-loop NTPase fold protein [Tahibacter caeni]|uniref:KAP family P-loop NTPase fold protein n=1 Tax=Tahibacter caeni TaxID=1453545 RepID=UPI002148FF1F